MERQNSQGNIRKLSDILPEVMEEIERRYREGGGIWGIPTGYKELDYPLNGFGKQCLYIIAARTSMGKTTFALNMIKFMALKMPVMPALFSCEMDVFQIAIRIIADTGEIELLHLIKGDLNEVEFDKLNEAASKLYNTHVYIDDTPYISLDELRVRAKWLKDNGTGIIFIDYLSLIKLADKMPKWERIGEIGLQLKILARTLDLPIVAMAQLNREAEGKKAGLEHLRYSGQLEEDSDVVIMMHGDRSEEDESIFHFNIAKNRHGPTKKFDLMFNKKYMRFFPIEKDCKEMRKNK